MTWRTTTVVSLTWVPLVGAAAATYVLTGSHNDSPEYYTRLPDFQLFAFVYTRWLFIATGFVVALVVASRQRPDRSAIKPIISTAATFVVCEMLARLVWGR